MALTPIGFGNFSKIPEVNLTINLPTESNEWIPAIITGFNSVPFGNFIIMCVWMALSFWVLTDVTPFGKFRYSYPRGLVMSFGIVSVLSITFLEAGFFTDLKMTGVFVSLFILAYIFFLNVENKE